MCPMPADTTVALSGEDALHRTITAMAGPDAAPRPDQLRAVAELVDNRRRVLVVQATGWGKSAVYWAATAALRSHGAGPTLVVSPLLALMRDQIAAAERAGAFQPTPRIPRVRQASRAIGSNSSSNERSRRPAGPRPAARSPCPR